MNLKPGFHIVITGRWVSLTVFQGHWSICVVGNHCQSLAVFQGRWQFFMVVNCLSKSSFKLLYLTPNLLTDVGGLLGSLAVAKGILFCFRMTQMRRQGRWRSFMVVHGRWDRPRVYPSDPVVDCLWRSLLVFAKISFLFPYSRSQFLTNFQIYKRPQKTTNDCIETRLKRSYML